MVSPKDKEQKYVTPEFTNSQIAEDEGVMRFQRRTKRRILARKARFGLENRAEALALAPLFVSPRHIEMPDDGIPRGNALFNCLGYKIAYLRKEKGWLQKDLAKETGISVSYISKLERGYQIEGVTLDILLTLANVLEVTLKDLFDFSKEDVYFAYYRLKIHSYS